MSDIDYLKKDELTDIQYMERQRDKWRSQASWYARSSCKTIGCSEKYRIFMRDECRAKARHYEAALNALKALEKSKEANDEY